MTPDPNFFVSTESALLDTVFVIRELRSTYWGNWRSPETILRSMDNSICFGLYQRQECDGKPSQIGFARVVTDGATFAWVCDVFVHEAFRARGLGRLLMETVVTDPRVKDRSILIRTRDAQDFYRKLGFETVEAMRKLPATPPVH